MVGSVRVIVLDTLTGTELAQATRRAVFLGPDLLPELVELFAGRGPGGRQVAAAIVATRVEAA